MWIEYVRALWPVVVGLSSLMAAAVGLWLASRFASKSSYETLHNKFDGLNLTLAAHEGRLSHIEDHLKSEPTRQQLQDEMAQLGERLAHVEASVKGISKQLETTNRYLHTLIESKIK